MSPQSDRELLVQGYRIIKKAQTGQVDPQDVSNWLVEVHRDIPDIARLAGDHELEAEEYAREIDKEEIGT